MTGMEQIGWCQELPLPQSLRIVDGTPLFTRGISGDQRRIKGFHWEQKQPEQMPKQMAFFPLKMGCFVHQYAIGRLASIHTNTNDQTRVAAQTYAMPEPCM